jgi:putative spermidine/putrescine transport system ATP-binding protein
MDLDLTRPSELGSVRARSAANGAGVRADHDEVEARAPGVSSSSGVHLKKGGASKLSVRALRKNYGTVKALAGVDLELHEGEFITLLGPSGSGKSTMLMTIAGLTQPDSGEVWIDGRLSTFLPPHKREIGVVFQNYALFPHLTVYENIAFPLRMRRRTRAQIDHEVTRVLGIVQLPNMAERYPRELSGGQQQRIALARCMVYQPPIILMDEPLGALDKKLRQQLQFEVRRLHQQFGISVLYVTHDQEEALAMSDRICLMNEGAVEQIGTPADLYFRPRSVFAADFLGESNLLDVNLLSTDGDLANVRAADGSLLRAACRQALAGDRIRLLVRPENLRVLAANESADNTLTGVVRDVILLGQVTKYFVRLSDGVEVSAASLTESGRPVQAPGMPVRLGFAAESAVCLPAT